MSSTDTDEVLRQIEDCEKRAGRMTEWEQGFIANVRARIEQGVALTRKQNDQLDLIWGRLTSRRST